MPVNSTLLHGYNRDLEKVNAQGKEEFDQVVMGYHVKDVAPVGSQVDVPATGAAEEGAAEGQTRGLRAFPLHRGG